MAEQTAFNRLSRITQKLRSKALFFLNGIIYHLQWESGLERQEMGLESIYHISVGNTIVIPFFYCLILYDGIAQESPQNYKMV